MTAIALIEDKGFQGADGMASRNASGQLSQNIFSGKCLPELMAITCIPVCYDQILNNIILIIFKSAAFRQVIGFDGNRS